MVNPRHQTPQGQSVAKPGTLLQNILDGNLNMTQRSPKVTCSGRYSDGMSRGKNIQGGVHLHISDDRDNINKHEAIREHRPPPCLTWGINQSSQAWNSLLENPENFMDIRLCFPCNVVNRQTNSQTDKYSNKQRWKHDLRHSVEVTTTTRLVFRYSTMSVTYDHP